MNKLPEPFKTDWIKALRSGEYKQGNGMLFYDNSFCCLGVGEMICGTPPYAMSGVQWPRRLSRPHSPLANESNLSESELAKLASMNDAGKSFSEIADYIEQNL